MKKMIQLTIILFLSLIGHLHAQNISTGITDGGAALPVGAIDPNWRITAGPTGPVNALNSIPAFAWQSTPVSGSNAGWINATGLPLSNLSGTYTFERSFTISNSVAAFTATMKAAYDDSLVSLAIIDPYGTIIPLTVTPTTPYYLSLPVSYTQNSPTAGTWRIQAVLYIVHEYQLNGGGFMLDGEIITSCTPLCNCEALIPDFETQLDLCNGNFTSTSEIPPCIKETGTDSYEWTINGNYTGSTSSLSYTFPSNGTYTVCLKIGGTLPDGTICEKEFCKEIEVKNCSGCVCDSVIPNIDYNVDKCSGVFNGTTSLPACLNGSQVSYNWFVNSTYVGSGSPFIYSFPGNGFYTVCLSATVILPDGTKCTQDTCVEILVNNCGDCHCNQVQPDFNYTVNNCVGTFVNTTTGPDCVQRTYKWFVDSVLVGTGNTFSYAFPGSGTYTVCLKVVGVMPGGVPCKPFICKEITVNCGGSCCDSLQPKITYNVDKCSSILNGSAIVPACLNGATVSYTWLINSTYAGSGATLIHPFPGNGIYTVCLYATVILADGTKCTQDTCIEVLVNNCDECKCNQVQPDFNFSVSNCVGTFVNTTTGPDCVQRTYKWFVDSVLVGTGNTFSYAFPGSGTYTVCMKVVGVMPGGIPCKPFICKEITVDCGPCNCYDLNSDFSTSFNMCNGTFVSTSQVPTCLSNVHYEWSVDGNPAGTATTLNYAFSTFGPHNVCLKVIGTMPDGTTCTRDACYEVYPPELCPDPCNCQNIIPVFSINGFICNATFDASAASVPACLQNVTYKWYVGITGSGILSPVGTGTTLPFSFPGTGNYTVCLMISGYLPDGTYCEKMECEDVNAVCLEVEPGGLPGHTPHGKTITIILYPNPASDDLTVQMELEEASEVQITMRSSDGKELLTEKIQAEAGLQRFNLKIPESIANSMVFIEVISGDEKVTRMVNILKK